MENSSKLPDMAFTATETALILKLSTWQVYELAKQKDSGLRCFHIGKRVLFSKEAIENFIRYCEQKVC